MASKTKAELIADAHAAGYTDVDDSWTVADIEARLAEPDAPAEGEQLTGADASEAGLDVSTEGVNAENINAEGDYVGTEMVPQVETPNANPDPNPHYPETGHRFAEKFSDGEAITAEAEDGTTLTWTDVDAIPGTIGDDPDETMRALHAAGSPSVKAE